MKKVSALSVIVLLAGIMALAQAQDDVTLSKKELENLSETMKTYIDAKLEDERGDELEAKQSLAETIKTLEGQYSVDDLLKLNNLWHRIREGTIDSSNKIFRSKGRGFKAAEFVDETEVDQRNYIFYFSLPKEYDPEGEKRFPVIIFLHPEIEGKNKKADKETLKILKTVYDDDQLLSEYIIIAPVGPEIVERKKKRLVDAGRDWENLDGRKTAFMAIRKMMENMVFDRSRVVLDGIGKAGLSAYRFASWYPSFFSAVIGRDVPMGDVAMENTRGIPVLYVSSSENTNKAAAEKWIAGYGEDSPVKIELLEDSGTVMKPAEDAAASMREWLVKVEKDTAPQKIFLKTSDLATAGAYWIRVEDLNAGLDMALNDPKYPWVEGSVDPESNTIVVDSSNILKIRIFLSDKVVDLDKKVTVVFNGNKRFEGKVERNLDKMLDLIFYNQAGDFEIYCNSIELAEELK